MQCPKHGGASSTVPLPDASLYPVKPLRAKPSCCDSFILSPSVGSMPTIEPSTQRGWTRSDHAARRSERFRAKRLRSCSRAESNSSSVRMRFPSTSSAVTDQPTVQSVVDAKSMRRGPVSKITSIHPPFPFFVMVTASQPFSCSSLRMHARCAKEHHSNFTGFPDITSPSRRLHAHCAAQHPRGAVLASAHQPITARRTSKRSDATLLRSAHTLPKRIASVRVAAWMTLAICLPAFSV